MASIKSPIPVQDELIFVDEHTLILEFRATFRNETAHLPEVSLRYLIWLILSGQPFDDVRRFANQIRLDLNHERLQRVITDASLFGGLKNAGSNALAVG